MADDSTNPKVMSGYELAKKILLHYISTKSHCDPSDEEEAVISNGGIDMLLELSDNDENDWFELKAGMYPSDDDEKKGVKPKDVHWHTAKAVLSLMNTSGGALVIGISEGDHSLVPLRGKNDQQHLIKGARMEDYRRREIYERIRPYQNRTWEAPQNKEEWTIVNAVESDMIEVYGCMYQKEEIAVVLVKPAKMPVRIQKNKGGDLILHRVPGGVGKVETISDYEGLHSYIEKHPSHIEDEKYAALYRRFLKTIESESEEARLNEKIEAYYKWFEEVLKKDKVFGLSCFTPLDASGEISAEETEEVFMEPQAVEVIIEDDSWLEDNDDVDFKEHNFDKENENDDDNADDADDELNEDEEDDEEENDSRYREKRSGDLLELMRDIPRIAVLGEPGGGKTTTLKRFAMQFHQPESKDQILAVFIPMGQWRAGGSLSLLLEKTTGLAPAEWQTLIETKRLWLVIDAVNECPDGFRKAAILNIHNFTSEHPELPVAISARTDEDLKLLRLPTFTVQPMDAEHQLNYLASYLKDAEQAQALFDRLRGQSGGMEIAANPMLLRLVVEVYKAEGMLSSGRADLYHRWIKLWYNRENSKAKAAGEPLPWDFNKALEIFSELAFQSRLQGYRDVPMEIVESILDKFGEDCIAKLCQGPVVIADEDFIRFRHETFQEYLCAEYLILHPDVLPPLTKVDSAQWGMPLAYAAELCWPLPEPLWRAAWAIDPWFGFAVTDDEQLEQAEELVSEALNPLLLFVFSICISSRDNSLFSFSITNLFYDLEFWYSNIEQKLGYVVLTKEQIKKRWLRIELALLEKAKTGNNTYRVLIRSIVLKLYAGHSIKQTLQNIKDAGKDILSKSFAEHIRTLEVLLLSEIGMQKGIVLMQNGFASKDDFRISLPQWIQKASIDDAIQIINSGLATKEDFEKRIIKWIKGISPNNANYLIQKGLATKDFFLDNAALWINDVVGPRTASIFIQEGFATKQNFMNRIKEWKLEAEPKDAILLIQKGFAFPQDFRHRIDKWGTDPQAALYLIHNGLATKEDFRHRIDKWGTDPQMMDFLLQNGLTTKDGSNIVEVSNKNTDSDREKQLIKDQNSIQFPPYSVSSLVYPLVCEAIQNDLCGKKWKMRLKLHKAFYSIFTGKPFSDTVFCKNSLLTDGPIANGSIWLIEVYVRYNEKRESYSFCVKSAEFVSLEEQQPPDAEQSSDANPG